MRRRKRYAVVLIQRPDDWTPANDCDLPPSAVLQSRLSLCQAADIARKFNATEQASPSGFWAVAAKGGAP
jgi:hypothetical protein